MSSQHRNSQILILRNPSEIMPELSEIATYPSLRNKNVLITGGAEGIGAAAVEMFARQHSKVLILDISQSSAQSLIDRIVSLSNQIASSGGQRLPIPSFYSCDVTDLDQVQAVAQEVLDEYKVIHVLINNASSVGSASRRDTPNVTRQSWDFDFNVNLRHMFFFTQAFVPAMKDNRGGSIVYMGSISWMIPAQGLPAYTSTKAATLGLTRSHSKEFGPWNIRVNNVMPGSTATQRQLDEVLTPEYRAQVWAAQSLKRDVAPMEVAKVVLFLASDEASAVTGSSYVVDAGWCG